MIKNKIKYQVLFLQKQASKQTNEQNLKELCICNHDESNAFSVSGI